MDEDMELDAGVSQAMANDYQQQQQQQPFNGQMATGIEGGRKMLYVFLVFHS